MCADDGSLGVCVDDGEMCAQVTVECVRGVRAQMTAECVRG